MPKKQITPADTIRRAIAASGKTPYAIALAAGIDARGLRRFIAGDDMRLETAGPLMAALDLEVQQKKK